MLEDLRALAPAVVLFPGTPESLRATARALDLAPGIFDGCATPSVGEALVVRGDEATAVQVLPLHLP
jgi:hypothetical protein